MTFAGDDLDEDEAAKRHRRYTESLRQNEVDMGQRTICPRCQRTFAGSNSLRQHLRDKHGAT